MTRYSPLTRALADPLDNPGLAEFPLERSPKLQSHLVTEAAELALPLAALTNLVHMPPMASLDALPEPAIAAIPTAANLGAVSSMARNVSTVTTAETAQAPSLEAMAVRIPAPTKLGTAASANAPIRSFQQLWTGADMPTDPLFGRQWHLYNTGQTGGTAGVDINILPVWHLGITGAGVSVGVYDTAMDVKHVDLKANIDLSKMITSVPSRTFVDPTVITSVDQHATSVAGLIAGSRNGVGEVGVAYGAKITPVDILGVQKGTYGWEALWQSYKFDVTNHSWGFTSPFSVSPTNASNQYWVMEGFNTASIYGRKGLGTIQNLAAGNYRQSGMTTELTGVTVNRHVNVIGAVDYNGMVSYYSNPGASLLVVAPSSSIAPGSGITTTDVTGSRGYTTGDYTNGFGGTSAATPIVSGVVAAMLQANPNLGWRDVQTILAITAKHVGSAIGAAKSGYEADTWSWNAARNWNGGGMHFSNDYGFGLVDAFGAVELAKTWNVVMPTQASANELAASATLSGAWNIGAARTNVLSFTLNQHINVEAMSLTFPTLSFAKANHLSVTLTSPDGTSSTLLYNNGGSSAYISGGWELMSREFLNQDAYGTWKVTIVDNTASDIGTLTRATLTVYGGSATAANSVFFYTDEFAQYWTAARGQLNYAGVAAVDAAATTGAMSLNLLNRQGTIDGKSLTISATATVTKVITGDGVASITCNNSGNTVVSGLSNDVLVGGTGADTLDGGAGTNTITTGGGADKVKLHRGALDYLTDFIPGMDKLVLSASEFAALAGGVTAAKFVTGSAATTRVAGGGLVFDASTSTLYADMGVASAPLQTLAKFTNQANVRANDFLVS